MPKGCRPLIWMVEDGDVMSRNCRIWFWQTLFSELINMQIIKKSTLKVAEFVAFLQK